MPDNQSVSVRNECVRMASMETFFSHADAQFDAVCEPTMCDAAPSIATEDFLRHCDKVHCCCVRSQSISMMQVVDFIDCFGTMYTPIKHDVGGNVTKVRSAYQVAPEECATLDALLARDWAVHQPIDGTLPYSAEGFLWLTR